MRLRRKRSDGAARRGDAPSAGTAHEEDETSAVAVVSLAMRGTLLIERCGSSAGLRWKMVRHIERTALASATVRLRARLRSR